MPNERSAAFHPKEVSEAIGESGGRIDASRLGQAFSDPTRETDRKSIEEII